MHKYLRKNNISKIDYCINDLIQHNFDNIVVGIDSYKNLKQIINFKPLKYQNKLVDFTINDLRLTDPRKWKIWKLKME